MTTGQREHNRRRINLPMVYTAMDGEGTVRTNGVGRALDVSPNGLMVETREPIHEKNLRILITVSDERTIAIDGVLIYSLLYGPETYRTGIKLVGPDETVSDFIAGLQ